LLVALTHNMAVEAWLGQPRSRIHEKDDGALVVVQVPSRHAPIGWELLGLLGSLAGASGLMYNWRRGQDTKANVEREREATKLKMQQERETTHRAKAEAEARAMKEAAIETGRLAARAAGGGTAGRGSYGVVRGRREGAVATEKGPVAPLKTPLPPLPDWDPEK